LNQRLSAILVLAYNGVLALCDMMDSNAFANIKHFIHSHPAFYSEACGTVGALHFFLWPANQSSSWHACKGQIV
jgi:hypothetical protein